MTGRPERPGVEPRPTSRHRGPATPDERTLAREERPVEPVHRPESVLTLQRLAGNAAVSSGLPRRTSGNHAPLQRWFGSSKTGIERIREIHGDWWVGPFDEVELEELWGELGDEGAKRYPKDFAKSIDRGMDPSALPGSADVVAHFRETVEQRAIDYLDGNLEDLDQEERSLGIDADSVGPGHEANLADVVRLAQRAKRLDELAKSYSSIQVGYKTMLQHTGPDLGGGLSGGVTAVEVPALFSPGKPPPRNLRGDEGAGAKAYGEVLASYEETMGGLMAVADQHPSIYLALKSGQLDAVASDSAEASPREAISTVLADARRAIEESRADPPSWQELKILHGQLLRGDVRAGLIDWHEPWYRAIVTDSVGDYETDQTIADVSIGLAAALCFVFSGVATGGLATVLWAGAGLGIGAANVAKKYDSYNELKNAAAAGTSSATELVGQGQVDAARLDLIIEAAFAFFDAAGVAMRAGRGISALVTARAGREAAEEAAGTAALKELAAMEPGTAAADAISRGIDQVGVRQTADAAGMSVDELLAKVPHGHPAEAKLLEHSWARAAGVETSRLPEALATSLRGEPVLSAGGTPLTAEILTIQAIHELGYQDTLRAAGGWKNIAAALGPTSEVGRRFKTWRDGIFTDLEKYIESLRTTADGDEPLIQKTGTLENVTNDLDISFLGPRATENRTKAAQYLAGRTGLEAAPPTLDRMLYIGLFTDPRRIHFFDEFPELQQRLAQRTMKFEEELIWNDEYFRWLKRAAREEPGAQDMVEQIASEMDSLGVTRMSRFSPLSHRAVDVLSRRQDRLHEGLEAARRSGDMAQVERLVEEMATTQAQINVKEGGGYFSAGGVRRFVTEREGFPGSRSAATSAHHLGAALDQVNKLRSAIARFEADALQPVTTRQSAAIARHIKDLAKYGDRFTEAARVLGQEVQGGDAFIRCADEFSDLIQQARGETLHSTLELLRRNMEGVVEKTRTAIAGFDELHVEILRALRERSGIAEVGDLAPDILRATRVRYLFLRFGETLIGQMVAAAWNAGISPQLRAKAAADAREQETGESARERPPMGDFPEPSPHRRPA